MNHEYAWGLSRIDDDEWSWTVQRKDETVRAWGSAAETIAEGCAYSKAQALEEIDRALGVHGKTRQTAARLPF